MPCCSCRRESTAAGMLLLLLCLQLMCSCSAHPHGDYFVLEDSSSSRQTLLSLLLSMFHSDLVSKGELAPNGTLVLEVSHRTLQSIGDRCQLSENAAGVCILHDDCLSRTLGQQYGKRLEQCLTDNNVPVVCCPLQQTVAAPPPQTSAPQVTENPMNLLDVRQKEPNQENRLLGERSKRACEEYTKIHKDLRSAIGEQECEEFYYDGPGVVGGEPAFPREFPHMAAIGFGEETRIRWQCGGSLISSRYVLTAAHCLTSSTGLARWVRLGDLDLYDDSDDAKPQQFTVLERIAHPDYEPPSLYNDIALLKLDKDAVFDTYVRPACLNTDDDIADNVGEVTGWGLVDWESSEGSSILMKATLPVQLAMECQRTYKTLATTPRLRNGFDDTTMLCVGDEQGEKDTCKGDSGGPYHRRTTDNMQCVNVIAGVTSFGKSVCGAVNSPAVYTSVAAFVDWIENIVWP